MRSPEPAAAPRRTTFASRRVTRYALVLLVLAAVAGGVVDRGRDSSGGPRPAPSPAASPSPAATPGPAATSPG